jgi:hypothetical protein
VPDADSSPVTTNRVRVLISRTDDSRPPWTSTLTRLAGFTGWPAAALKEMRAAGPDGSVVSPELSGAPLVATEQAASSDAPTVANAATRSDDREIPLGLLITTVDAQPPSSVASGDSDHDLLLDDCNKCCRCRV